MPPLLPFRPLIKRISGSLFFFLLNFHFVSVCTTIYKRVFSRPFSHPRFARFFFTSLLLFSAKCLFAAIFFFCIRLKCTDSVHIVTRCYHVFISYLMVCSFRIHQTGGGWPQRLAGRQAGSSCARRAAVHIFRFASVYKCKNKMREKKAGNKKAKNKKKIIKRITRGQCLCGRSHFPSNPSRRCSDGCSIHDATVPSTQRLGATSRNINI